MAETFTSPKQKLSYALGLSIASNIIGAGIKEIESEQVVAALNDALNGSDLKMSAEEANATIQQYLQELQSKAGQVN